MAGFSVRYVVVVVMNVEVLKLQAVLTTMLADKMQLIIRLIDTEG